LLTGAHAWTLEPLILRFALSDYQPAQTYAIFHNSRRAWLVRGFRGKVQFSPWLDAAAKVAAEKLASSHSEGLGLPEESAFSWVWRRKADPSLRSG
jgi:hypothetical protein